MSDTLTGQCVLLVEDDYFLADEMQRALAECGAEVLGPVGRVDEALRLISGVTRLNGAVLDINLHEEMVYPVADALRERGVPFVFATGYERSVIPERFSDVRRCEKPVAPEQVARALFG